VWTAFGVRREDGGCIVRIGLFSVPYLTTFGWMKRSAPNYVPLGTASLAAFLRRKGHDVTAIACDLSGISVDEGIRNLISFRPDLIGLSATTPGYPIACQIARILKGRTDAPICIGGIHASARPRESLRDCEAFDLVVAGEGEQPLHELLGLMSNGRPLSGSSPPASVLWRDSDHILEGPPGGFLENLDELPFPAYDLFAVKNCRPPVYFDFGLHPSVNVMTSRGCPARCCFCASKLTMGSRYRTFSAAYIYELIRYLKKDFGIRFISFTDDTFTMRKERVIEICSRLQQSGMDLKWTCFSRADGVDRGLINEMAKAGCVGLNYGIETGNPKTLVQIGKGCRLEDGVRAVDGARAAGLRIVCSYITGFPKETPAMAEDTIEFAVRLNSDLALFNTLVPYPGTPVSREALRPEFYDGIDWTVMRTSTTGAGPVIEGERRTSADLVRWVKRANRKFYLRMGFFAKIPRLLPRNFSVAFRCLSGILGLAIKTIRIKPAARSLDHSN
jgi:anaerobic magnesium-protoporphyrin IX monomethyl ester cyclase